MKAAQSLKKMILRIQKGDLGSPARYFVISGGNLYIRSNLLVEIF